MVYFVGLLTTHFLPFRGLGREDSNNINIWRVTTASSVPTNGAGRQRSAGASQAQRARRDYNNYASTRRTHCTRTLITIIYTCYSISYTKRSSYRLKHQTRRFRSTSSKFIWKNKRFQTLARVWVLWSCLLCLIHDTILSCLPGTDNI